MKKAMFAALAGASLVGLLSVSAMAADAKTDREKCYGVAKAGKNDCAGKTGGNSCAGTQTKDGDANNWIYLPKGICAKLVNGKVGE